MLPKGPKWKCKPWKTVYPTKNPVKLFYRDSVECVKSLLQSPLMKDYLQFSPLRVFETAEKLVRIYGDWLTGDVAWNMQVRPTFPKV